MVRRVDPGERSETNVRPLQRIRVLLVSRDRRFLRVAAFVLGRAGFEVETVTSRSEAYTTIQGENTDVAVIDADGARVEVARFIGALEALYPLVATVVVDGRGEGERSASGHVLAKWDCVPVLADAIERAYLRLQPESSADAG